MNSCCYCFNLKTGSTIAIILTLIYSVIQLLSIVSSDPVVYGSVLHPPTLPRHDLLYYNSIALITYLSLLVFASPALFAIYKEKYFLLLPWLTANIVSVLLEFLVFFHLLSKIKKTQFSPISAFTFSIAFLILMIQLYSIFGVYCLFSQHKIQQESASSSTNYQKSPEDENDPSVEISSKIMKRSLRIISKRGSLSQISEENHEAENNNEETERKQELLTRDGSFEEKNIIYFDKSEKRFLKKLMSGNIVKQKITNV